MATTPTDEARAHEGGLGRYAACWIALVLLTGLTFGLSTLELGRWSLPVALCIAVTKGTIVALFFMHLWDHPGVIRLSLVIAAFFVVLLVTLVVADVKTRFPPALPLGEGSPENRAPPGSPRDADPGLARPPSGDPGR